MLLAGFLVPEPGIEPGWIAPTVFETVASTDSAIRAFADEIKIMSPSVAGVMTVDLDGDKVRHFFCFRQESGVF